MKNIDIGHVSKCQICSCRKLETILSFGHQPVVQNYLNAEQIHNSETTYPLNLCRCIKCGLLQIDYIVDPRVVFPLNYPYRTGLTNMLIRNFRSLADILEKKFNLKPKDLVIDIGSNDGTLLEGFKAKGMRVLGIEPTDAAKVANKKGIPTIQDFINQKTVKKIIKKYGKAKIVTATNVFAHINNVSGLMKNIKNLLADDGIFVSESQYIMDIIDKLEFDTIYHEHLRFYSLKPLIRLFSLYGCSLVDAERISAAGGSIRVYMMKGKHPLNNNVKKLIAIEEKKGIYDRRFLRKWAEKVIRAKNDLVELLLRLKKKNNHIVGLSNPARSNTLLGFAKINSDLLDYACEKKGSPKIGLFSPGMHIRVLDESKIFQDQPKYVLVLSWHIGEELMKKIRELGYRGKFIMPLPVPKIINRL